MVPVKQTAELIFQDGVRGYERAWDERDRENLLVESFGQWLGMRSVTDRNILVQTVCERTGARRTYQSVAASSYLVASGLNEGDLVNYFNEGFNWLVKRQSQFEGSPTGVCVDGVALFGIAVAAHHHGHLTEQKVAQWFEGFLHRGVDLPGVPLWQRALMAIAGRRVGLDLLLPKLSANESDVALFCSWRDFDVLSPEKRDEIGVAFVQLLRSGPSTGLEPERIALRLALNRWTLEISKSVPTKNTSIDDVVRVLQRLSAAFHRWTWEKAARTSRRKAQSRQWHIENEYHFQSALWFLLAPLFPDLKEEEFTDSVGQLQPRADLIIPCLKLVIEVKFMYRKTTAREMIEQIAADNSLYLKQGSPYAHIIPVIWDDEARVEEHDKLISGLRQLRGVYEAIVVSRPSIMRGA